MSEFGSQVGVSAPLNTVLQTCSPFVDATHLLSSPPWWPPDGQRVHWPTWYIGRGSGYAVVFSPQPCECIHHTCTSWTSWTSYRCINRDVGEQEVAQPCCPPFWHACCWQEPLRRTRLQVGALAGGQPPPQVRCHKPACYSTHWQHVPAL